MDSIGEYIRKRLRLKNISNEEAGKSIGLSESAFEKILLKEDIHIDRLLKLSLLLNENLLHYYNDKDPLKSFRDNELIAWKSEIEDLNEMLRLKDELLLSKEEIIELQRKYILELENKSK